MIDPDDLAAFRAAVADIAPLPPVNRVVPAAPKVLPLRRSCNTETAPPDRKKAPPASWPSQWQIGAAEHPASPIPVGDVESFAVYAELAGITPLPPANRVQLGKPLPPPRPLHHLADEQAALHESLHGQIGLQDRLEGGDEPHYLRSGLATVTLRDLRRGRWVIQSEVDLHGLNRDQARQLLAAFLADCLQQGRRCVRIIHGKGHGSPQKLSILRQLVRGWLAQRDEVLAYCQARPQDGGEGALIALLRSPKKTRVA